MKQWPYGVSKKIYGVSGAYVENSESTDFDSGKKKTFNKNTAVKRSFTVMLTLQDKGSNSEFKRFDSWYVSTLCGTAESFEFPDITGSGKNKEYRMTEPPTWTGTTKKEITMEWEEV